MPRHPSKRAHREALEVAPSGIVSGLDLGHLISSYSVGSLRKVGTEAAAAWARVFVDLHDALPDPLDASNEEGEDRVGLEIIEKQSNEEVQPPVSEPPKEGIWWQRPEDIRVPFERFGPVWDVYLPKDYCFMGYSGEPERRNSRYVYCVLSNSNYVSNYFCCSISYQIIYGLTNFREVPVPFTLLLSSLSWPSSVKVKVGQQSYSLAPRERDELEDGRRSYSPAGRGGGERDADTNGNRTGAVPSEMLDYNVLGGKCNRGLFVIDSYNTLQGVDVLSKEETFLACTLGWCIEWLQAYFLVLDDIMDNSQTRRGQPCWFMVPQVGLIAVNDGIILRNHISRILQRHFKGKPYYVDLIDLFNEVEFKTASGQLLDLITTHEGEKDLTKYNLNVEFHLQGPVQC
ncbi:Farnesyl pyrophosphate synthetase [Hordeum vulgare]|nr:Farnesyl pyrophosphate synthetase [Hordeum vulgare]